MATSTPRSRSLLDRTLVAVEILAGIAVVVAVVGEAYGAAPTFFFLLGGLALAFSLYMTARMLGSLSDPSLDATDGIEDERRLAMEHEKKLILQGIKELEVDAAIGKVDPNDYQHLRAKAEGDALGIIQTLKAEDDKWLAEARRLVKDRLGAEAAQGPAPAATEAKGGPVAVPPSAAEERARAAAKADGAALADLFVDTMVQFAGDHHVCSHCGAENPAHARYCVSCGRPGDADGDAPAEASAGAPDTAETAEATS